MEIKLKFTENKNGARPGRNGNYAVLYLDWITCKKHLAGAHWNGEKFIYCAQRWEVPNAVPSWEQKKDCNYILGFYFLPDFEE